MHRLNPITKRITTHNGVDFALPVGTEVISVADGKIITVGNNKNSGNYIIIKHNNYYITKYMHLNKILIKKWEKIKQGDVIALSGNTGRSTGPHLHYEIWIKNHPTDPMKINLPYVKKLLSDNEKKIYFYHFKKILLQLQ